MRYMLAGAGAGNTSTDIRLILQKSEYLFEIN